MEQKRKNKALYWIIFLISTAGFLYAIDVHWVWLIFILPFVATSFVKAMDII
ncbi:MAG: hypothetical protein IT214_00480 [Chitinophagaceae bacterium]|nr:hypothetical protein [Chitinophagaceae bacterium]